MTEILVGCCWCSIMPAATTSPAGGLRPSAERFVVSRFGYEEDVADLMNHE
jgi:hypothetical protein